MWQQLVDAAPLFFRGVGVTVQYTIIGALGAVVLAFVFGLMAMSPAIAIRGLARTIVEFFRGTSLLVQLLWLYYALPLVGFQLTEMAAATTGLALNFGAYGSEIVRGAILSVPKAQWEATVALSLSPIQRMRRVILPQAIPEMIPPFGNLLVQMLKGSSLLFLLSVQELTFEVQELRDQIGSLPAFLIAILVYFVLAQLFLVLMRWWEQRASVKVGRGRVKKERVAEIGLGG